MKRGKSCARIGVVFKALCRKEKKPWIKNASFRWRKSYHLKTVRSMS